MLVAARILFTFQFLSSILLRFAEFFVPKLPIDLPEYEYKHRSFDFASPHTKSRV